MKNALSVKDLPIRGMKIIQLDRRIDERGWFEETWNSEKFSELGIFNFFPVQANTSFNLDIGITRGMHAEPWSKLITIVSGSAFCAWVDLRDGPSYMKTYWINVTPGMSIFIPEGVANGYQTTSTNTVYSYLVDGYWSEKVAYKKLNAFDPRLKIIWPLGQEESKLSPADLALPKVGPLPKFEERPLVILGHQGQVGGALHSRFPFAKTLAKTEIEKALIENSLEELIPFGATVINAAAYTNVDDSESPLGRSHAMKSNFYLVESLAKAVNKADGTLVHISSDFVFDGSKKGAYSETDDANPLNSYGHSKLLGDFAAIQAKKHLVFRVSGVYGNGSNFVRTIAQRAFKGMSCSVINDSMFRPTSALNLAELIESALMANVPFGIYNFTDGGQPISWFDLARKIYGHLGVSEDLVLPISSANYRKSHPESATRPSNSVLDLSKVSSLGLVKMTNWEFGISEYLNGLRPD